MKKFFVVLLAICLVQSISLKSLAMEKQDDGEILISKYLSFSSNLKYDDGKVFNVLVGEEGEYLYETREGQLEKYIKENNATELNDIEIKFDAKFESEDNTVLEVTPDGKWKALKEGEVEVKCLVSYSEETMRLVMEKNPNIKFDPWISWSGIGIIFGETSDYSGFRFVINIYKNLKPIYRLYNKANGDHLYTIKEGEKNKLVDKGWKEEKIVGVVQDSSRDGEADSPVYRLYNKRNGVHHYTTKKSEKNTLVKTGWKDEGIAFYSPEFGTAVSRYYNVNSPNGTHLFTSSAKEKEKVNSYGWKDEDIGWYCVIR